MTFQPRATEQSREYGSQASPFREQGRYHFDPAAQSAEPPKHCRNERRTTLIIWWNAQLEKVRIFWQHGTDASGDLGVLGNGFNAFGMLLNNLVSGGSGGEGSGGLGAMVDLIGTLLNIPGFAGGGDHKGGWRIVGLPAGIVPMTAAALTRPWWERYIGLPFRGGARSPVGGWWRSSTPVNWVLISRFTVKFQRMTSSVSPRP